MGRKIFKEILFENFTSTTQDKNIAEKFSWNGCIIELKLRYGKKIWQYSRYEN